MGSLRWRFKVARLADVLGDHLGKDVRLTRTYYYQSLIKAIHESSSLTEVVRLAASVGSVHMAAITDAWSKPQVWL